MDPVRATELERNLIPFSAGHRSCIGRKYILQNHSRSMALTNIQKVVATILRRYHIEAVDEKEELKTFSVGIVEKAGPLLCRIRFRNTHSK
jgi:cytochrome P450